MRLIERADVFVHNFRPQAAARLQVEYERVRALNPGIVYCATYGFRAAGPYGNKPVYDDIIQAASGLASLQAPLVGDPRYLPTIVADKTSSMAVAHALLAALYHKARTGEGQAIEVPMFETVVAWMMVEHLYGETFLPALDTAGYKRVLNKWRRPFPTKDGYLGDHPLHRRPLADVLPRRRPRGPARRPAVRHPRVAAHPHRVASTRSWGRSRPPAPTRSGSVSSTPPTCPPPSSTPSSPS